MLKQSEEESVVRPALTFASGAQDKNFDAVITRNFDFWLMGGASIFAFFLVAFGGLIRSHSLSVDRALDSLTITFSVLALVCNYPHFIFSYKFAYGRGPGFILKNWFQLLFVPFGLLAVFTLAYFGFETPLDTYLPVSAVNSLASLLGITFDLGQVNDVGQEILSTSIWLMLICVGWHYSKQVFGSMMVYSKYDGYPISKIQRTLIKVCLFSIAIANFFTLSGQSRNQYSYLGFKINTLVFPNFLSGLTTWSSAFLIVACVYGVGFQNFRRFQKWPSLNFAVPFVAFCLWWFPWFVNPLFYIVLAPFFHCLQYLPFAYRMTNDKNLAPTPLRTFRYSLVVLGVVLVGFLVFDAVPAKLDEALRSQWNFGCAFFLIATIVFMNIHHFFIDSVVWRLGRPEVKKALF